MNQVTPSQAQTTVVSEPLLEVIHLNKNFAVGRHGRIVCAVDDASFDLRVGETLGIVGESGSGKTTLARIIMGLETSTSGSVKILGKDQSALSKREIQSSRTVMQMVLQDPYSSLNPRMTIFQLVSEPWAIHKGLLPRSEWKAEAELLLEKVGLDRSVMSRTPRAFSGGQRQRIALARALAVNPRILILDEPVSALDVSIQAQIIELLRNLQTEFGLSMVFIAHDLAVVRSLADRIGVIYLGQMVETGPIEQVYENPAHPYTKALLSAAPRLSSENSVESIELVGEIPSPMDVPSGCAFRTRCWKAQEICATIRPSLAESKDQGRRVACHFPEA